MSGRPEAISEHSTNQIRKVIEVLSDIFESIITGQQKESEDYENYQYWCKEQEESVSRALDEAKDVRDQMLVQKTSEDSALTTLSAKFDSLTENGERTRQIMAKAESMRSKELERYNGDMQTNRQSLDQVNQAITIVGGVKSNKGFLQHGQLQHIKLNEPGESSYVLGIMKGIRDKLDSTKAELQGDEGKKQSEHQLFLAAKKEELASLETERSSVRESLTAARIAQVETKRLLEHNQKEVQNLEKRLQSTTSSCKAKVESYAVRLKEYEHEKMALAQAIDEIMRSSHVTGLALPQLLKKSLNRTAAGGSNSRVVRLRAKLVGKVRKDGVAEAFLQVQSARARTGAAHGRAGIAQDVVGVIGAGAAQAANATHQHTTDRGPGFAGFVALLAGGKIGRGDVAQEMVLKLIARLKQEQAHEEEKHYNCTVGLKKRNAEFVSVGEDLMKRDAAINQKEAEIVTLGSERDAIEEAIESLARDREGIGLMRKEEHEEHMRKKKDRGLTLKVLKKAATILEHFYAALDKTAHNWDLLQAHGRNSPRGGTNELPVEGPKTWTDGTSTRKSIRSASAVAMIEKVRLEVIEEGKEADKEEAMNLAAYEGFLVKLTEEHDMLRDEATQRAKRQGKLKVELNSDREKLAELEEDLWSIQALIHSLHEECDSLIATIKQRSHARTFEIGQLKDVMDILAGASIAQRADLPKGDSQALLEQSSGALSPRERALIHDLSQGSR